MFSQTIAQANEVHACEDDLRTGNSARGAAQSPQETFEPFPRSLPPSAQPGLSMADLEIGRIIGTGSSALVRIAHVKATGQPLALKSMKKCSLQITKGTARAHSEKLILSKLSHPLIVSFRGSFQDTQNLYLALEYVPGGELYSYLQRRDHLGKEEARFFAAKVVGALTYLHKEGVMYRDLKPENVLITASGSIKLTDLGLAKQLKDGERTYSLCGTPQFMAPEIVTRAGHDFKCDWWTLGILLFEMLTGTTPFQAETPYEIYSNIVSKDFQVPKEADEETASILRGLLKKDPSLRLSDTDVQHHSFFEGIDWQNLEALSPFYVPVIKDPLDDSNFDWYEEEESDTAVVTNQSVFEGY